MKILVLGRYALGVCASIVFGACNSSGGSQLAPSGASAYLRNHSTVPGLSSGSLIYVSSAGSDSVYVYPYPRVNHHQTLTGFSSPRGLCDDKYGNVWITDAGAADVIEYAHGGTSPIATLSDPGQNPVSCAVDSKTGNLAVANITTTGSESGSISVYKKAKGSPTVIPAFAQTYYDSFDSEGNLYVDGFDEGQSFQLGEIIKGTTAVVPLTLIGATVNFPGGLQYTGGALAIGDTLRSTGTVIYKAVVSGSTATVKSTTQLQNYPSLDGDIVEFRILGNTHRVICADSENRTVQIFNYPAGGKPVRRLYLTGGSDPGPSGVAISSL